MTYKLLLLEEKLKLSDFSNVFLAGDWNVWITPGKEEHMATKNGVFIMVYGTSGKSEPLILRNNEDDFKHASTSEFIVSIQTYFIYTT